MPMLPSLLLGGALALGQPPTAGEFPPAPPPWFSPLAQFPTGPGPAPAVFADQPSSGMGTLPPPAGQNGATTGAAGCESCTDSYPLHPGFARRLLTAYGVEFGFVKLEENGNGDEPEPPRRALPGPLQSPPFPSAEWQGYPLVGVPPDSSVYPLMKAIYGGPFGDEIKESRIKAYGWLNASGNWSTSKKSNTPDSYWIVPNRLELDQFIFRVERQVDSVQTDYIEWGFRSTVLYGMDYRYMMAGGWGSDQLFKHNNLYGWDPTEQYFDLYIPYVAQGMILRLGRWIACPDIETQFAPDNYMGSHSLLFTFDTYTQTGLMATVMLNKQWTVQAAIHSGTDMAPWYPGAIPTGMFGVRWTASDNNDSVYLVLNAINNAQFRYFTMDGQPFGHDNFNYIVGTWQHKFNDTVHTKFEAYYMWENNAVVGGTPSIGPVEPFGGGGGIGATIPGLSQANGVLNYTEVFLDKKNFITFRNEWWKDETGFRTGFAGNYTSNAIGFTHNFNSVFQVRPEIGYYRNWDRPAFDDGTRKNMLMYGFDMTMRF
jgi:hypothetical protein